MICALLLDCEDSPDFPDNDGVALGRPLACYPLMAAKTNGRIARTYAVTGSQRVKSAAAQYGAVVLDPPGDSTEASARTERLLRHGWRAAQEDLKGEVAPELLVVLFANAPAVTGALIADGIEALQTRPELDSAVTVSLNNRRHPACARRLGSDGMLEPYSPQTSCPTDDVWYPNWSLQVLRPRCLAAKSAGQPPFPWLGAKVWPLKQWGGGAIDYQWQIPAFEYWLKKQGFSDSTASLEPQPKPQPSAKPDRR